jgi:hypothetical protein
MELLAYAAYLIIVGGAFIRAQVSQLAASQLAQ